MDENKNPALDAIAKLISLTRDGKIDWKHEEPKHLSEKHAESVIGSVFTTQYKDKRLRIYQHTFKEIQHSLSLLTVLLKQTTYPKLEPTWRKEIVLDIVDDNRYSLWDFPKEHILNDLYSLVKYKSSGADEIIESLLAD